MPDAVGLLDELDVEVDSRFGGARQSLLSP
jgi:hypothetical protein